MNIAAVSVSKSFAQRRLRSHGSEAVSDVSLVIDRGTCTAILGPAGSGKSTLLALLAGMYPPSTGEIRLDGVRISRTGDGALADFRRRWVGYVPQSPALLEDFTLLENVVAPHVFLETSMRELKERALALLDRLGLRGKSGLKPPELSGEEKKLAVTARALVKEPHFLFADEPVAALNNGSAAAVLTLFSELQARGAAVVAANRTPLSIKPAPRTYKLLGGRIVEIRGGKY